MRPQVDEFVVAPVSLDNSLIYGHGLFAKRRIRRVELIGEYERKRLFMEVAEKREEDYLLRFIGCYFMTLAGDVYFPKKLHREGHQGNIFIDAIVSGILTWFLIHSCTSNCTTDEMIHGALPVVAIFAAKDIPCNAQLT